MNKTDLTNYYEELSLMAYGQAEETSYPFFAFGGDDDDEGEGYEDDDALDDLFGYEDDDFDDDFDDDEFDDDEFPDGFGIGDDFDDDQDVD